MQKINVDRNFSQLSELVLFLLQIIQIIPILTKLNTKI